MLTQQLVCLTFMSMSFLAFQAPACEAQTHRGPSRIVINDEDGPIASRAFAAQFDAVVSLSFEDESFCSGSLIAPDAVLTARHCTVFVGDSVDFGADSNFPIFSTQVTSVTDPGGVGVDTLDGGDVSILRLAEPIPESVATPLRLTSETSSLVGRTAATVGYGLNGVGSVGHENTGDNRRWAGTNVIDAFGQAVDPEFSDFGRNIFSTDFDDGTTNGNTIPGSDPTPTRLEATTALGDSGGPLLIEFDGEWLIAGVLSEGTTDISDYGDISWWTSIAEFRMEIESVGGVFVDSIPEPSSAALLALLLAPLAALRR